LTIFNWEPGQPQGESFAMGQAFDIFAQDSLGNYIYMTGYSVSDNGGPAEQYEWSSYPPSTGNGPYGTNKTYVILFSISGGPCDQWEGADKPFTIVGEGITTATMATTRTGTAGTEAASEREEIHPKSDRTHGINAQEHNSSLSPAPLMRPDRATPGACKFRVGGSAFLSFLSFL